MIYGNLKCYECPFYNDEEYISHGGLNFFYCEWIGAEYFESNSECLIREMDCFPEWDDK